MRLFLYFCLNSRGDNNSDWSVDGNGWTGTECDYNRWKPPLNKWSGRNRKNCEGTKKTIYCILIEFMVVSKVYFIINNFLLPQKNYTQKKVHTRIALKYMKRNIFGKHILLEIQPLADYLYFPCRIQMRRRSLQRQIQMDSTQIHKQEWMFSDRNALRKVWPLANSSTLYTSPPAYKYISCILIQNTISSKGKSALYLYYGMTEVDRKQNSKATIGNN